jgi:hypothetical protein
MYHVWSQVFQIEAHLDEDFPHDKIQLGPIVDQCFGHIVSPNQ